MPRYRCDLQGRCIEHPYVGEFDTLEECQAECRGLGTREDLDLAYLILGYDLEKLTQLSPGDQQEVIFRTFGVRIPADRLGNVSYALAMNNLEDLLKDPSGAFEEYVESQIDDVDVLLFQIRDLCPDQGDYPRYRRMFDRVVRQILQEHRSGHYGMDSAIHNLVISSTIGQGYYSTCLTQEDWDSVYRLLEGWMPYLVQIY